ncbi:MAG: YdcF family protein [Cyclobacteriaceae bacterium]|nr:YdcF family protein [Cyclobacteriaceae bacterium]
MPIGLILIGFLLSIVLKSEKWKKRCRNVTFGLLLFFTNPFLANEAMEQWEIPPIPYQQLTKKYDLAIVLTGVANNTKEPRDRIYFNKGADRVTHSLQLYKKGIVKKILLSGGTGSLNHVDYREADQLKEALLLMGVPEKDIILENESANTRGSAVNTHRFIAEQPHYQNLLLVTSSFHMRRASGCYEKVGLKTDLFPVDFYTHPRKWDILQLVPTVDALKMWSVIIHEVLGVMAYWAMGYI